MENFKPSRREAMKQVLGTDMTETANQGIPAPVERPVENEANDVELSRREVLERLAGFSAVATTGSSVEDTKDDAKTIPMSAERQADNVKKEPTLSRRAFWGGLFGR